MLSGQGQGEQGKKGRGKGGAREGFLWGRGKGGFGGFLGWFLWDFLN